MRKICFKCKVRTPRSKWNDLCLICLGNVARDIAAQIKAFGPIVGSED